MIDTKSRVLAAVGALILLFVVIDLVRRRKLKEEYSVLWVAAALTLLLLAIWYQLLGWITTAIGGVALSSTLFFFALLFIFFVLLHYSVRISELERRLTALVQESALSGVAPLTPSATSEEHTQARICVIIPCFNDGEFLVEAVHSVQETEDIEVVVVDDGSTDKRTGEVLRTMEAKGVGVVRRPNGGVGAARMTGLVTSRARYVYPLDSDDRLEPGALRDMADALDRAPEAAFAWGDYTIFGAEKGRYRSPDRWLPWTLTYVNPYPACSMFRRSALEHAGGWEALPAYEDWDLWIRLAGMGLSGLRVDRVVYRRRLHATPRMSGARQRHQELYAEIERRNRGVFDRRAELRAVEQPAVWKRVVYPVAFGARPVIPIPVEAFLQRTMMRLGTGLPS